MSKKTTKEDFYSCKRCKISSDTKDRMCPCPRGGCESEITGVIIITREVKLNKSKTKKK